MREFLFVLGFTAASVGCGNDENQPASPASSGLSAAAFPNNTASLTTGGGAVQGTITGGMPPYNISTQPDSAVATAALSGTNNSLLTLVPVGEGTTSVVIEDNSSGTSEDPTPLTLAIAINVTEGGGFIGGTGSLTVSTSLGTFSADGTFDTAAVSGQGVGAIRVTQNGEERLEIVAYSIRSVSDADLIFLSFNYPNGSLMTATYPFEVLPANSPYALFLVGFGIDLNNAQNEDFYGATTGSATLTTLTSTNALGTFSGSGSNLQNPFQTFTFTSGTFTVDGFGIGGSLGKKVTEVVSRVLEQANSRRGGQ